MAEYLKEKPLDSQTLIFPGAIANSLSQKLGVLDEAGGLLNALQKMRDEAIL